MLRMAFKKVIGWCNHVIVTLRFSILSIFISIFVIAMMILMSLSYRHSSRDIVFIGKQSMDDVTKSLQQKFKSDFQLAERDASITSLLLTRHILNPDDLNVMINYFYSLAEHFNIVQGIYWGDVDGNYVSAEYQEDETIDSYYTSFEKRIELNLDRDLSGKIVTTKTIWSDFDPRKRPWYQDAIKAKMPLWTDIYAYQPSGYLGITLATPVYEKYKQLRGVLGVDIRLDWLSVYIDTLHLTPNGIVFIVNENGKVIAYPNFGKLPKQVTLLDITQVPSKAVSKSYKIYQQNKQNHFTFYDHGEKYLATYLPVTLLKDHGWAVGVVVPEDDFIGTLNRAKNINMVVSFIILILGIVFVSKFVESIINPIKILIKETFKIKNFNLEGDFAVQSRIKEIIQLSDAINTMKLGLKAFQHYVPSKLVRQLIRTGENTKLGGDKKQIVSFFTDIKDFTVIAHQSDPTQLVLQLNEYFEAITNQITKEGGTIDKYIGDSVMAFWGAPEDIDDPCAHAARAGLKFIKELSELNQRWIAEGKSPFYTRIGIHVGDAIVGNIGSSERINYTAVGDSINIASRLEGMNKQFNTNVLVSEAVYLMIKDQFTLREVGFVSLKGIAEEMLVYELVG